MARAEIFIIAGLLVALAGPAPAAPRRPAPARPVHIDGAAEGNAGMEALQKGDNDGAIRHFTLALQSGDLKDDDIAFAHANRGRAYLNKGAMSAGIADLDLARQMKPDDLDAQTDLATAISTIVPAGAMPGLPKPGFLKLLGNSVLQGIAAGLTAPTQEAPQ